VCSRSSRSGKEAGDLSRHLNKIIEIDPYARSARVQPWAAGRKLSVSAPDRSPRRGLTAAALDVVARAGHGHRVDTGGKLHEPSRSQVATATERTSAASGPGSPGSSASAQLALAGHRYEQLLRAALHDSHPADAIASWVGLAAAELEASSWADGCPVATVTLETAHTSAVLAAACQAALGGWHAAITEAITARGIGRADALRLASLVLAGIEGGLLLARAYRSSEPLRAVGGELTTILRARIPDARRP
jgi:TetR/AcrR family transcriptional repressor of lmrAB and yxaGH operons